MDRGPAHPRRRWLGGRQLGVTAAASRRSPALLRRSRTREQVGSAPPAGFHPDLRHADRARQAGASRRRDPAAARGNYLAALSEDDELARTSQRREGGTLA